MGVRVRDLIRMVERDGWVQVRQTGSHRQFHHPTKPGTVTIAGTPSTELPPKTLKSVLRQAGLEDSKP
jgi:predicted RNA binding protein YcfA (HicA-like mRNA interferase family)